MLIFFFSSRRRHTRYIGDWSSDVCSSDLKKSHQLGELQNFPNRSIQAEQDETRTDVARRFEAFHQRRHAGTVNVTNCPKVEHDSRHFQFAKLAQKRLPQLR